MKQVLVIVLAILAVGAVCAEDAEMAAYRHFMKFKYFAEEGVYLGEVSNEAANAIVAEGIASSDTIIREVTLSALAGMAHHEGKSLPGPFGSLPSRNFSEVPGLKRFLIAEWYEWHAKTGYNLHAAQAQAARYKQHLSEGAEGVVAVVTMEKLREDMSTNASAWTLIPEMLCVYWPGDPQVLELLWKYRDADLSPNAPYRVLEWLIRGAFATPEANAYRMKILRDALSSPGDTKTGTVALAAVGLALSKPEQSLPLILQAADEYPEAAVQVLLAVSEYPQDMLAAHAPEVESFLRSVQIDRPMGVEVEAYKRVESTLHGLPN